MSTMYASLFPEHLKNLVLLTAPVKFPREEMGAYSLFTDNKYLAPISLPTPSATSPGSSSTRATGC